MPERHRPWKDELFRVSDPEIKSLGISTAQRSWLRGAITYSLGGFHCVFPLYSETEGWMDCVSDRDVQLHHVLPKGFGSRVCQENPDNNPYNFIPLCKMHHIGSSEYRGTLDHHNQVVPIIHPDIEWARRNYQGTNHPTSYDMVFQGRRKLTDNDREYWNQDYDLYLVTRAREIIDNYIISHYGDVYPIK